MVLGNTLGKEAGGVFPSSLLLFVEELLAASSLLPGVSGSSLLAVASGLLVEELLATGSLLAGASGLLVEELLATGSLLAGTSSSGLLAIVGGLEVSCPCRLDHVVKGLFLDHVLPLRSAPLVLFNRASPRSTFPLREMCRLVLLRHRRVGPRRWPSRHRSRMVFVTGTHAPVHIA